MTQRALQRSLVVSGSIVLLAVMQVAATPPPLRVATALWVMFACPGLAFLPLLPALEAPAAIALGAGISLVAGVLVTTTLLAAGAFSAAAGLAALAVVSLAGCAVQLGAAAARRPPDVVVVFDARPPAPEHG